MKLIFGYKHISGVPPCPCNSPGTYMMMEQYPDEPLKVKFSCWCGSTSNATFDDEAEKAAFIKKNENK